MALTNVEVVGALCKTLSLECLQSLILRGKYGGQAGKLKPLDKLLVAEL